MILFRKASELHTYLEIQQKKGMQTGFIPTMGALHEGHLSLVKAARETTDLCVCSIFVNPTQFNDPKDFQKYPVTIEKDIYLLEKSGTDILFLPAVEEMYPGGLSGLEHYELGYLENILEGQYRPGHFQGVCQVMFRLLNMVQPQYLFMGQKDYQQCLVIKRLLSIMGSTTRFQTCATLREADGLAMSSRNMRLNLEEREKAAAIYQALNRIKTNLREGDLRFITNDAKTLLTDSNFKVDYVETADADTLKIVEYWDGKQPLVALIAAFQHETRLIDNLVLS